MQQETFGFQSNAGSGATPLSNITIANTLYVMKNGDDATALPDRLDKPYLTINAAAAAASFGDTIYVFSGLYNEGTADVFLSDINYVLGAGVTVQTSTPTVNDLSGAKNINISGTGILVCTDSAQYVVDVNNVNSTLNLTCSQILGEGGGLSVGGTLNVKVDYIETQALYDVGIFSEDVVTGVISVGNIFSAIKSVPNVYVTKANKNDGVARNLFLNFQKINANQSFQYAFQFTDNANTKIYLTCELCETLNGSDFCSVNDTKLFINNTNYVAFGASGAISTNSLTGILYITNSNFRCSGVCLSAIGQDSIQINNTLLKSTSQAAVILSEGELSVYDSVLVGGDGTRASTVIYLDNNETNPRLKIKNTELIETSTFGQCITPLNASNIGVYGQCASNVAVDPDITNVVAGTNIIVDSDVVQNTTNFF